MKNQTIAPCLWFDSEAEEAVNLYVSIFKNSKIGHISRYGKEGFEFHGKKEGSVMTVGFQLNGIAFTALNGGPKFSFTEAVSFQIMCDTQEEIDHYWDGLTKEGEEGPCGWLKDKYGLSWQIVPSVLPDLLSDPKKSVAVMKAVFQMKKMDIHAILNAVRD